MACIFKINSIKSHVTWNQYIDPFMLSNIHGKVLCPLLIICETNYNYWSWLYDFCLSPPLNRPPGKTIRIVLGYSKIICTKAPSWAGCQISVWCFSTNFSLNYKCILKYPVFLHVLANFEAICAQDVEIRHWPHGRGEICFFTRASTSISSAHPASDYWRLPQ
jgi:hypothetical protein